MNLIVSSQKISEQKADCFGFLLQEKEDALSEIKACEKKLGVTSAPFIKKQDFTHIAVSLSVHVIIQI